MLAWHSPGGASGVRSMSEHRSAAPPKLAEQSEQFATQQLAVAFCAKRGETVAAIRFLFKQEFVFYVHGRVRRNHRSLSERAPWRWRASGAHKLSAECAVCLCRSLLRNDIKCHRYFFNFDMLYFFKCFQFLKSLKLSVYLVWFGFVSCLIGRVTCMYFGHVT